jgi:hypothetical protein
MFGWRFSPGSGEVRGRFGRSFGRGFSRGDWFLRRGFGVRDGWGLSLHLGPIAARGLITLYGWGFLLFFFLFSLLPFFRYGDPPSVRGNPAGGRTAAEQGRV